MEPATDSMGYENATNCSYAVVRDHFSLAVNVVVMGCVSVLGIVCNILSLFTLQRDKRKLPMTVLLQGLATSDTLFLLYTLLYSTLRTAVNSTDPRRYRHLSDVIVAYVLPCGWMGQTTSIWIVVLVTMDRYLAVVHPFTAEKLCTVRRARFVLLATWLASIVFNLPRFFYYHHLVFDATFTCEHGTYVAHVDVDGIWAIYRNVYHLGLTIAFLFAIPLPILVVLNSRLMGEITRAKTREQDLDPSTRPKDTRKVTLNLVVVVSVFILCETPDFVASVLKIGTIEQHLNKTAMTYFLSIRELLLVLNAAGNFFIYCLFYAKFRRLLVGMLCPKLKMKIFDTPTDSYAKSCNVNSVTTQGTTNQ